MRSIYLAAGFLGTLLVATPVMAEQRNDDMEGSLRQYATKENIGRAVGAAAGALIGTQFAEGSTRLFTAALGGIAGFLIGGEIGRELSMEDQAGLAEVTRSALETGEDQRWNNPDTGIDARVMVSDGLIGRVRELPVIELINGYYETQSNVNVRGGPGTGYAILHRIETSQRVPVIGQVSGSDWYMVADKSAGGGFVYAPLLFRDPVQPVSGNAIREAYATVHTVRSYAVDQQSCRVIDQSVVLPDGTTRTRQFRACRRNDGDWTEVRA